MASSPIGRAREEWDEDLGPLPPVDGDGDAPDEPAEPDDPLGDVPGGEAGADDATGEDEPIDASVLEIAEHEASWIGEEPAPDPGAELELDVSFDDPADGRIDEDGGVALDGWDAGPDELEPVALDGGDEGPIGPDRDLLSEEALPALDADEEGEITDEGLLDGRFAPDDFLGLPSASHPWDRVGSPFPIREATAVACVARGAIVAGRSEAGSRELVRVDLEGACQALAGAGPGDSEVVSLVATGDDLAVVLKSGALLASRDGGASFAPVLEGVPVAEVLGAGGGLWIRTRDGKLLRSGPGALDPAAIPLAGFVSAIAADGASAWALLSADESAPPVALMHVWPSGAGERQTIDGAGDGPRLPMAVRADWVAYGGRRGVVRRDKEGHRQFFGCEGTITALAVLDESGTIVAATYSEADDTSGLIRIDPEGRSTVVARIGADTDDPEHDGRASALSFDEARGVVWVAGGFGIAAFAVR
jgi:hypothetical protein